MNVLDRREIVNKYNHSPKGFLVRRKYNQTEKAKAKYARYRDTDEYRKYARDRYHHMDENKRRARYTVRNAVRAGRLIRPSKCEKCGREDWGIKRSMIEANHYLGYEPENWLKIEWLCTTCHKVADGFVGKEVVPYVED